MQSVAGAYLPHFRGKLDRKIAKLVSLRLMGRK